MMDLRTPAYSMVCAGGQSRSRTRSTETNLLVPARPFARDQLPLVREASSPFELVASIAVCFYLGVGVGFWEASVSNGGWSSRESGWSLPYALLLNAFFIPAMVSAKRTCCDAMSSSVRRSVDNANVRWWVVAFAREQGRLTSQDLV